MASGPPYTTSIQLNDVPPSPPAPPARPIGPRTPLHEYYSRLPESVAEKFQDLDSDSVYEACEKALLNPDTRNFIVDFGGPPGAGGQAWCALDIDASTPEGIKGLEQLLGEQVCFLS
jgi:hypothetical protein